MLLAAPVHYDIDQQKTGIVLSWRAFGGILSQAWLKDVTGKVTLDPDNEFNDQIQVTIPVATLVASNSLLTWQLKSNMFFDAARATRQSPLSATGSLPFRRGIFGCLACWT
jgi:polyisoprenoid-binding protein YceI